MKLVNSVYSQRKNNKNTLYSLQKITFMKKIGIIAKRRQAEKFTPLFKEIYKFLKQEKKEIYIEKKIAEQIKLKNYQPFNRGKTKVDLLIVLGGDGTILSVLRSIINCNTKLFGINIGTLGFLSEVKPKNIQSTLKKIFADKFYIDERLMIQVEIMREKKCIKKFHALNEVVISHSGLARLIQLKTKINQKKLTTYHADGLIIATPTGSTAYSLSAGGPIIYPSLNTLIITPICPHSFTQKPIVIPDEKTIEIEVQEKEKVRASVDGQQSIELKEGDIVKITKHGQAQFIRMSNEGFFKTLRQKLDWGKKLEK